MESVAKSYGLALFELAEEQDDLDGYWQALQFMAASLDREAIAFFGQPMISKEARLDLLEQCFSGSVPDYVLSFSKLLIRKERFSSFKEIIADFRDRYEQARKIIHGDVYTALPLSAEEISRLEGAVSKKEGMTVKLNAILDKELLSGVKVVVHDHVYDGSLKNKMTLLKNELLKGSR